jgi:integrase
VYGKTKGEAQEKLRAVQADADAGRLVETEQLTAGEYLKRWLDHTAKPKVHDGTWERYREVTDLYLIPTIGVVKLAKVSALHVEQCYAAMAASSSDRNPASAWTRKMAGVVLSQAFKHAVKLKLVSHNPAADVAKARPVAREMRFMTEPQGRTFLGAVRGHRLYPLFALALGSGMRQGELLGLQWGDIDFERATLDVRRSLSQVKGKFVLKEPKSKTSRRSVALPKFALDSLREHRQAALKAGLIAAPVFCTGAGTYIGRGNLTRLFKSLVRKANTLDARRAAEAGREPDPIPAGLRFHDLRHTHASNLIAAGHSIKAVSRRLGHADITITLKVYAHLMPNDDEKLAAGAEALFG